MSSADVQNTTADIKADDFRCVSSYTNTQKINIAMFYCKPDIRLASVQ